MADSTKARPDRSTGTVITSRADGPKRSASPSVAITTGAALWAR